MEIARYGNAFPITTPAATMKGRGCRKGKTDSIARGNAKCATARIRPVVLPEPMESLVTAVGESAPAVCVTDTTIVVRERIPVAVKTEPGFRMAPTD